MVILGLPMAAPARSVMRAADRGDISDRARELRHTDLPLPRFASLGADEVNLRVGPGIRYPIEWVYKREGFPVEIVAEFSTWRKVRDWTGTTGWIHRALLTGRRHAILKVREALLRREPATDAPPVAKVEFGVVSRLLACDGPWCRIETHGLEGWVPRATIWGTLPGEKLE